MNAIEFSNKFARTAKDFFARCIGTEPLPLHKMQDVTVSLSDDGFCLRLETTEHDFSQEFDVTGTEIVPLCFETR